MTSRLSNSCAIRAGARLNLSTMLTSSIFERIVFNNDLFGTVFAAYFVSLEPTREFLMRLVAPRSMALHSRSIGKKNDAILAASETRDYC
jgi:hypothetical protein